VTSFTLPSQLCRIVGKIEGFEEYKRGYDTNKKPPESALIRLISAISEGFEFIGARGFEPPTT
jgi:hypothetical protein